jgi:hypothetical protein
MIPVYGRTGRIGIHRLAYLYLTIIHENRPF